MIAILSASAPSAEVPITIGPDRNARSFMTAGTWGAATAVKLQFDMPTKGWSDTGVEVTAAAPSAVFHPMQGKYRLLVVNEDGTTDIEVYVD